MKVTRLFIEFPYRVDAYDLIEQDDCFAFVVIGYQCNARTGVFPHNLLYSTNLYDQLSVAVITDGQLMIRRLALPQPRIDTRLIADNANVCLHASHDPVCPEESKNVPSKKKAKRGYASTKRGAA